ncbi:chorismate mutase [Pseudomonadota bacterium]|nr:chorismate mutase [Pseudomonadota bacterium]
MDNTDLEILRSKIDEIDTNLCQLIKERQSLASKIMNAKKGNFPFDPNREEKLIKKLVTSGLDKFLVEKVWRQIISANLSLQKVLKIGVAGNDDEIKSVYSAHFGNYFNTTYFLSVVSLLASLEKKDIEIGFVDSESLIKLKNHTDIKVNFQIIADVPLYKTSNQKNYNIIKLKNDK